ncbi:actin-related protein 2/3 complex subunit 2A-like isoform X4 [Populus alba x Populus x berolinensis]|uniref:Arp2/3 complex 34 kDa subunit n=1 Tax=Populus alba x Populus x berolinensis TaxID=444605 RepID=A0AAD6R9Z3_9ROSI|nr:actin-related protein 2/3 complex subunit 2A-like isoform X4 [Populus alba x Populus x berolinensis]
MILLQSHSRFLLQTLLNRVQNLEKAVELDYHWVEFDDVRYHILVSMKNPNVLLLSVSLPIPPPEAVFIGGLPFGAIEALKAAYGVVVQILDPPRDGFNLTLKLNFGKLPLDEEHRHALLVKIASVREVVLGAPLRVVLKHLSSRTVIPGIDGLLALVHRSKESFFLVPQPDKVTVVFPMRFKDSIDIAFATSFLQEFVEARHTAGLNNAPPCLWSPNPPLELKEAPAEALSANAGFVSFGNVTGIATISSLLFYCSITNCAIHETMQSFFLVMWKAKSWTGQCGIYQHFMHMLAIMLSARRVLCILACEDV